MITGTTLLRKVAGWGVNQGIDPIEGDLDEGEKLMRNGPLDTECETLKNYFIYLGLFYLFIIIMNLTDLECLSL